jgi:hypothetical protein
MLETHLSGAVVMNEKYIVQRSSPTLLVWGTRDWALAWWVVSYNKVRWTIYNFSAFETPGEDEIFPPLLQEVVIGMGMTMFWTCIALGYVPLSWRIVRVVFVPMAWHTS